MTTTIEDAFGSRQMVRGFLLNNELTDFSFLPADAAGRPIANRVEPGKRPRSSMSPTLVFDCHTGQLVMSVGSPGGAAIIHYTAKTLLGTLAWQMGPQAAIDLPNVVHTNGAALVLEKGRFDAATLQALRARGYTVQEQELTSGLQALTAPQAQPPGPWRGVAGRGGADPRREGVVLGD
jgi:gamma-glutamyltranspeptidase/glutathione hydrolase